MSIQVLGYWAAICMLAWDPTNIRDGPNLSHVIEGTAHLLAPHKSHLQSKSFSEAERERSEVNLEIEYQAIRPRSGPSQPHPRPFLRLFSLGFLE